MISKQYKCPKCGNPINIMANYDVDPDYGESIKLAATCRHCQDNRYDSLDEFDYGYRIKRLVEHLGT